VDLKHVAKPTMGSVIGAMFFNLTEMFRKWREAEHSPPSSANVRNAWSYTSTTPIHFHGVVLS